MSKSIRDYIQLVENERQKGKCLKDTGFSQPYVFSYRAMAATTKTFKPMDYITLSKKFAVEHAEHMAAVEGEDYHVIRAYVRVEVVFEAYNPGEYFYDGPELAGKVFHVAKSGY